MGLVTGIDPFGAVSAEKVTVVLEAAEPFHDRNAFLLGTSGVNGAFVDHDAAGPDHFSDGFGGTDQRGEIGMLVFIHRRRDCNDKNISVPERFDIAAVPQKSG